MSAPQKFMFDNAFDTDQETIDPLEELRATFQEKIQQAKKEAFEEGRQAGEKAALTSIENQTKTALEGLLNKSAELDQIYKSELQDIKAKATEFGITAGSILASELIKKEPMPLIEEFFKTAFEIIGDKAEITAVLHPSMTEAVQNAITHWQMEASFQGKINFIANETLKPSDVSLTWKDGGIERSIEDLMQAINNAATNYFQAQNEQNRSMTEIEEPASNPPVPADVNQQPPETTPNQSERPS